MSVPAMRRIVVGVDGSAESVAALRWACREAALRGAEVHAVHVRENHRRSLASYAVPAVSEVSNPGDDDDSRQLDSVEELLRSFQAGQAPGVQVRVEVADGLAARVLLERCAGADMLVLGTSGDTAGSVRSAGPVIRACLRRSSCPVVVISAAQVPAQGREDAERAGARIPVGAGVPATAGV